MLSIQRTHGYSKLTEYEGKRTPLGWDRALGTHYFDVILNVSWGASVQATKGNMIQNRKSITNWSLSQPRVVRLPSYSVNFEYPWVLWIGDVSARLEHCRLIFEHGNHRPQGFPATRNTMDRNSDPRFWALWGAGKKFKLAPETKFFVLVFFTIKFEYKTCKKNWERYHSTILRHPNRRCCYFVTGFIWIPACTLLTTETWSWEIERSVSQIWYEHNLPEMIET